jgi:hypothetical protein
MEFLYNLFQDGAAFNTIKATRSAITSVFPVVEGNALMENEYLKRFMRTVRSLVPPAPKYQEGFDVSVFFDFFRIAPANADLSVKALRAKLVVLLHLFLRVRSDCLTYLFVKDIWEEEDAVRVVVRQSKTVKEPQEFWLPILDNEAGPSAPSQCCAHIWRARLVSGPQIPQAVRCSSAFPHHTRRCKLQPFAKWLLP